MKFNKSAESDFWYVGDEDDTHMGTIRQEKGILKFQSSIFCRKLTTKEMFEIAGFMLTQEKELGIDTTSTFTSLEDR